MRVRYRTVPQGLLLVSIIFLGFTGAASVNLTPGPDAEPQLQITDGVVTVPESYEYDLGADLEKNFDAQPRQVSLIYAGSELWQGTSCGAGSGNYAYAYPYFGFQVIDMTDPGSPTVVGKVYYPATPEDMVVDGDFVYVAAGSKQLLIFDVSDPYSPVLANRVETSSYARGVEIMETTAYVSADKFFLIVDVTDPYSPEILQSFDPGCCNAQHTVIVGDHAYIAADYALQVWDLSDINAPVFVGRRFSGGDSWDIVSAGNRAYMLGRKSGLYVLNAAYPYWPSTFGSWIDTSSYLYDVEIAGDYSYVTSPSSIRIIDVADPYNPVFSSSWPALGWNTNTYIDNERMYISDWAGGVSRYEISSPAAPALESVYESPGMGYDLAISGNYAYEANGIGGLKVLDITDPESPSVIGSYDIPGKAWTVEVIDQYVYVGSESSGIIIFDVSDPSALSLVQTYELAGIVYDIMAVGDLAYVTCRDLGLLILDITDPGAPVQLGNLVIPGIVFKLDIQGDYAYVSAYNEGLYIIDISSPSAPVQVGKYTATACYAALAYGDYAYFSCGYDHELSVLDISDPANPTLVGAFDFGFHWARHMQRVGEYLHVAAYLGGFKVFNISDPAAPYLTGQYSTSPGWTWDVDVVGDIIWVTCDNGLLSLAQGNCSGPDGTGMYSVADAVYLIAYIFQGGPPPVLEYSADVNCDGDINLGDAVYLVDFIFRGGSPPCGGCF